MSYAEVPVRAYVQAFSGKARGRCHLWSRCDAGVNTPEQNEAEGDRVSFSDWSRADVSSVGASSPGSFFQRSLMTISFFLRPLTVSDQVNVPK